MIYCAGHVVVNDVIRSAFERSVELQIQEAESREAMPHYHGRGRGKKASIKARDQNEPQSSQSDHVKIRIDVPEMSIPALDWSLGSTRRVSEHLDADNKIYTVVISIARDKTDELVEVLRSGIQGEANRRGSPVGEMDAFRIERVPGRKLGGGRRSYS